MDNIGHIRNVIIIGSRRSRASASASGFLDFSAIFFHWPHHTTFTPATPLKISLCAQLVFVVSSSLHGRFCPPLFLCIYNAFLYENQEIYKKPHRSLFHLLTFTCPVRHTDRESLPGCSIPKREIRILLLHYSVMAIMGFILLLRFCSILFFLFGFDFCVFLTGCFFFWSLLCIYFYAQSYWFSCMYMCLCRIVSLNFSWVELFICFYFL